MQKLDGVGFAAERLLLLALGGRLDEPLWILGGDLLNLATGFSPSWAAVFSVAQRCAEAGHRQARH